MAASKPQSKDDQVTEYVAVGKFPKNVVAACDAVAALFPAQVARAASSAYIEAQNSYWNASQRQKEPACFFQPTSAEQVSAAIVEVVRADCAFAIKGGGHSSNPDGSSIQSGFQFDLSKLNHVEISETDRTLKVGPGVHWGPLLKILESRGLSAVGGRDAGVGVPGFVFGGGLSYYSAQHGWGIDNLISFDIVLANGDLLTVDHKSHPDLNKALHGGGAFNFGIVTSLTLKLHSYDGMWGGMNVIDEDNFDAVWNAYDKYTSDLIEESKAHLIMDFFQHDGRMMVAQFMGFLASQPNPAIFRGLCSIPKVHDTLRLDQYSGLAKEMQEVTNSRGERNAYWTLAMRYDIKLLKHCYELWARMTKAYGDRFRFAFDVNHITPAMRNQAARQGTGNVYGLEGEDKPMTNILLTARWSHESEDELVASILQSLGDAIEATAYREGKGLGFKYMNYAHHYQDVIAGFGEQNKAFLLKVAAKYDPTEVFQRLRQGPFKLEKDRWE